MTKTWKRVHPGEVERWKAAVVDGHSAREIGRMFGREHGTILKYVNVPEENSETVTRRSRMLSKLTTCQRRKRSRRLSKLAAKKRYYGSLKSRLSSMFYTARRRAAAKGQPFLISREFLSSLYEEQGGRCALTGFEFVLDCPSSGWKNHPFSISLDRIDSSKGYSVDNVRFVITAINLAMSEWGEDVFREVIGAYLGCD